jgi:CPA2 family monovalent cation:H+ antiporter-2
VFDSLAKGEFKLPKENDSCLWLLVPKNSIIIGQKLVELNFEQQFGTAVRAIRRKGNYLRFPEESTTIQASDHLLLFGNLELLAQISQYIAPKENTARFPVLS